MSPSALSWLSASETQRAPRCVVPQIVRAASFSRAGGRAQRNQRSSLTRVQVARGIADGAADDDRRYAHLGCHLVADLHHPRRQQPHADAAAAGPHNDDNLYELTAKELKRRKIELLPANLLDATRHLEKDAVIREALGNTGSEDYVDYFVKTKQDEWQAYHEQVTPWEVNRYLTLF
jgi:hypothetical protein